jgi:hypothetical protein
MGLLLSTQTVLATAPEAANKRACTGDDKSSDRRILMTIWMNGSALRLDHKIPARLVSQLHGTATQHIRR